MAQAILEIGGKKYMSTKTAAQLWDVKTRTVADYCNKGRIIDKFKNGNAGWYISIDEVKPLTTEEIRRLLILTIQLKNKPSLEIDWSLFTFDDSKIELVYKYLAIQEYIERFNIENKKRIPYEVILTEKGIDVITTYTKNQSNSFTTNLQQWMPIVIQLAQLSLQVYAMC